VPHLLWDKFGPGNPDTVYNDCMGFMYWGWQFGLYYGLPAIAYTIQEASAGEFNFFGEMIPTPYKNSWWEGCWNGREDGMPQTLPNFLDLNELRL
jgi:hypothetical protein